jgi:cell wall-associated NlpC family hydrolase
VHGLDCSGLVQIALQAVGWEALRDSDMQEQTLGTALSPGEKLRRGDLVFWDGHVGIMADSETILHANGFHMMVAIEPLKVAVERIQKTGKPVTSIKRL